jgi:hypothetical protein
MAALSNKKKQKKKGKTSLGIVLQIILVSNSAPIYL